MAYGIHCQCSFQQVWAENGTAAAKQTWEYAIGVNSLPETRWGFDAGLFIEGLDRRVLVEFRYSPTLTNAFRTNALTVKNQSMEFLVGVCL
jgi:hypothetical protein